MRSRLGHHAYEALWQGLVLALGIVAAIVAPWWWLQLFFAVVTLYLLWALPRNPRTFWKRMFQAVLGAAQAIPALDLAGRVGSTSRRGSGSSSWAASPPCPAGCCRASRRSR